MRCGKPVWHSEGSCGTLARAFVASVGGNALHARGRGWACRAINPSLSQTALAGSVICRVIPFTATTPHGEDNLSNDPAYAAEHKDIVGLCVDPPEPLFSRSTRTVRSELPIALSRGLRIENGRAGIMT